MGGACLAERQKASGFEPEDTFVLAPCGRMCHATKFAGEPSSLRLPVFGAAE